MKVIFELLRWNKPSGRLILLVPAGWSLFLTPGSNLSLLLVFKIFLGGLLVSGFGCIANDIWDRGIDKKVIRTMNRPLAAKRISLRTAYGLLIIFILLSFLLTLSLPEEGRLLAICLAFISLPFIIFYPSAKRWFKYPQLILSFCWGFAVLIPWAAQEGNLNSFVLLFCWIATLFWTFGFDTVYALADKKYDLKIGVNSSAINLGSKTKITIQICYLTASISLAICSILSQLSIIFWPIWLITSILMQKDVRKIFKSEDLSLNKISRHFKNQVIYGTLILIGIIIG